MSKYDALWAYIQGRNEERLVLSFADTVLTKPQTPEMVLEEKQLQKQVYS